MANDVSIIYVGHSDPPHGQWKSIPDTPEDRQQALEDGFTASSTMSFAYEPDKEKPEPVRRGPLVLDLDSKKDPALAIAAAKRVVARLNMRYGVDPRSLRYFLSGGKGCHIEIPARLFGGEAGDPYLPLIHRSMIFLIGLAANPKQNALDMQMYCMGRGKLLRWPNIRRKNGRYKVPVSCEEFFTLDYGALERLTEVPRNGFDPGIAPAQPLPDFCRVYDLALNIWRKAANPYNPVSGLESLLSCVFMRHCYQNQATLTEPEWWVMISILATFGKLGSELIHEFSRDHPEYSEEATDQKILAGKAGGVSITCEYVRSLFDCGQKCGVRSPADLWRHKKSQDTVASAKFIQKSDGVYCSSGEDDEGAVKLCSPVTVLGKMRNPEGLGWARLLTVKTPDGKDRELCVYMRDFGGRGDAVRSQLLDSGVEIASSPRAQALLMEYLQTGARSVIPLLCITQVGWTKEIYVLPDAHFGGTFEEQVHFQTEDIDNLHNYSGTLEEWKEHVGRYCRGNSLLILATSYALTGPLLKPCGLEGGGVHIYGASSTGKTTCATVAGSVCGGGSRRGYLRQWRATHNALESTAAMHNDNLLILDEISQATGETVSQVAYMLANGQGKDRLRSNATRRKTYTWLLNFLSTGELTINDKIEENGKSIVLAGQEVRVIDLPVDGGNGQNVFENLHGVADCGALSDLLSDKSRQYYGVALRSFLGCLCKNKEAHVRGIGEAVNRFVNEVCPDVASGQVKRVAKKFGLIGVAGELGIAMGILPYNKNDAWNAAKKWFAIWLDQRKGVGDLEIERALEKVKDHFSRHGDDRYRKLDGPGASYTPFNCCGVTWESGGQRHYFIFDFELSALLRGVNAKAAVKEMEKRGWLIYRSTGNLLDTKSLDGRNRRGLGFIPSAWEK